MPLYFFGLRSLWLCDSVVIFLPSIPFLTVVELNSPNAGYGAAASVIPIWTSSITGVTPSLSSLNDLVESSRSGNPCAFQNI